MASIAIHNDSRCSPTKSICLDPVTTCTYGLMLYAGENIAIGNGRGWESAANAAVTSVNLWYAKEAIYDFSNPGFAKATSQPWSGLQQQKSVLEQLKCLMANGS